MSNIMHLHHCSTADDHGLASYVIRDLEAYQHTTDTSKVVVEVKS